MKTVVATFVISSLLGCFTTSQVPVEQLYQLNLGQGQESRLRSTTGDEVVVSPSSEITFETDDGQRQKLKFNRVAVAGNTLQGSNTTGQSVQIELTRIAAAEVRNLSGVKTGLLVGGITLAVLGGIIAGVAVAFSQQ